jgi:hypothetical protein
LRPPSRNGPQSGLAATQPCQSPGAFALDERFERLADKRRLLLKAREVAGLGQQFVVKGECGAHRRIPFEARKIASNDVDFNAGRRAVE